MAIFSIRWLLTSERQTLGHGIKRSFYRCHSPTSPLPQHCALDTRAKSELKGVSIFASTVASDHVPSRWVRFENHVSGITAKPPDASIPAASIGVGFVLQNHHSPCGTMRNAATPRLLLGPGPLRRGLTDPARQADAQQL